MKEKKKSDVIWVTVLGLICVGCVLWYLNDINNPTSKSDIDYKKGEEVIFNILPSLEGVTGSEVVETLGEPKEIFKEKIYTYVDSLAKYDFLVGETVKAVTMSMKYELSIVSVDKLLESLIEGYTKENIKDYKSEKVHDRTVVTIYDVDKYSKIEVSTKEASSLVDYIKIQYK